MKTVFITRDVTSDNYFKKTLEHIGFQVIGRYLIKFSPIPFQQIPTSDWIFFYSKNAIRFFGELGGFQRISHQKLATIGQPSANFLKKNFQLQAEFIGNGQPHETAQSFLQIAQYQTVLFPRASNSRQSIQRILNAQIKSIDLVIYENGIDSNCQIPQTDIVVFTSPMNVESYLNNRTLSPKTTIIAIGKTTAQKLIKTQVSSIIVANTPSEKGLVDAVLSASQIAL